MHGVVTIRSCSSFVPIEETERKIAKDKHPEWHDVAVRSFR